MTVTVNGQNIYTSDEELIVSESVDIYECEFEFDSTWDGWDKTAKFEGSGVTKEMILIDDKTSIPDEVIKEDGWMRVGVYGTRNAQVMPTIWGADIYVHHGTEPESTEITPTPSIYAQILALVASANDTAEAVQDAWEAVTASATTLPVGSSATVSFSDNNFAFGLPTGATGATGATGNGIQSIAKTGTSGLVDTYTITFTNGSTTTFTVTNGEKGDTGNTGATGNGISSITKTGTSGLVDTYTIAFTDGTSTTFTVTNGEDVNTADLAPAYSSSNTYAVGDYCIYSSQLYRCTTAITTAEAWTAAHWTAVTMGEDVSDLRSAFNALESGVMPPYPLESGTFSDNDGKTKSDRNDRVRTVDPIDIDEIVDIYAADGYVMWCFILDADKTYINVYSQSWVDAIDKSAILNRYSNAKYINVVFRDAVTSSKDLRELVSVIQDGTVYTSQTAENTNAAIDKINEFVNAENVPIGVNSKDYYLATNGAAASSNNFEIHKYRVTPNDLLYLNIGKRDGDEISVFQFQSYDNVPSGSNPYVVGSPYTDAYKGFIYVPDGATWLLVSYHRWDKAEVVQSCSLAIDDQLHDISALKLVTWSLGKNMVGNDSSRYYPVMLSVGDRVTISLTDSAAPTNDQPVYFYDKDFNQIEYWTLSRGYLTRTFTIVHDGICYAKVAPWFDGKKLQLEKGGVATAYEEYKDYVETLRPLINTDAFENYAFKLWNFKNVSSQYRKGNTSGSWYDRFVLLHHSDNHVGGTFQRNNLKEVSNIANDVAVDAVVNSGDMTTGGSASDTAAAVNAQFDIFTTLSTDVLKSTIPYLATLGNHDANDPSDTDDRELEATTKEGQWAHVYAPIAEKYSGIVWGDSEHYKHYHYYDLTKGSYKLRIIVLDSLDHPDYVSGDSSYICQAWEVYSQDQIDWLCNTALNIPSGEYGIIIVNHFPFAPYRSSGYSEEWAALNDGYFAQGWKMIPEIVRAWTNRTTLSKTYTDQKLNQQNIVVDADFSSVPSGALFVCFMCGHTHSKNAFSVKEENGEDFGQLMLCEDSTGQQGNALNRAYKYDNGIQNTAASQVTIDIAQRKVYRTAYGVYQHCSEEPMPETMIFSF